MKIKSLIPDQKLGLEQKLKNGYQILQWHQMSLQPYRIYVHNRKLNIGLPLLWDMSKWNVDAAFNMQTQEAKAGWIIRDAHGNAKY
ncbi:hypothetical protein Bca4012_018794 [Brassica carinata]